MYTTRLPGPFAMLASALAIAAAFAFAPGEATSAASASEGIETPASNPTPSTSSTVPPEEEPCPGGEPKPCGAPAKERESVESGREEVGKEVAEAKKDIATAKEKAEQCPPESKQCMEKLAGDGAQQRQGMEEVRQALQNFQPAPSDNAASVLDGTCAAFAADLPSVLTASGGLAQLTGVCELMKP